jgi:hypothetical protein
MSSATIATHQRSAKIELILIIYDRLYYKGRFLKTTTTRLLVLASDAVNKVVDLYRVGISGVIISPTELKMQPTIHLQS